jgi:hypothetical protein
MRLAASRMKFLHATGGQYSAKPPVFIKHAARTSRMTFLHATGGHPDTICLRLAARRTLFLYRIEQYTSQSTYIT